MDSVLAKTLKALFWKGGERAASKILRLFVQIALARFLAPEDFGVIAIVLVFITLADVFVLGGLNSALIQKDDADAIDYSTVFWLSIALAALFFMVIWFVSPIIANVYSNEQLVNLLRFVAIQFFPLAFNSVQVAKVSRELNFRPVFLSTLIAEIIAGIVAVCLALYGFGAWALAVQQILAAFFSCMVAAILIRWTPSCLFSLKSAKELFAFGWKNAAIGLWGTVVSGVYNLSIGKAYSQADLGYYSQGQRYPTAVSDMVTGTLSSVLLSSFSSVKHDVYKRRKLLYQALQLFSLFMIPLLLFFFIFAEEIVVFLLTEKWIACTPIFKVFCLGLIVKALSLIERQALLAINCAQECLRAATVTQVCRIVLLVPVLSFHCDISWVAICWNFAAIIELVALSVVCAKTISITTKDQIRSILPAILLSSLAAGASYAAFSFCQNTLCAMAVYFIALIMGYLCLYMRSGRKHNG